MPHVVWSCWRSCCLAQCQTAEVGILQVCGRWADGTGNCVDAGNFCQASLRRNLANEPTASRSDLDEKPRKFDSCDLTCMLYTCRYVYHIETLGLVLADSRLVLGSDAMRLMIEPDLICLTLCNSAVKPLHFSSYTSTTTHQFHPIKCTQNAYWFLTLGVHFIHTLQTLASMAHPLSEQAFLVRKKWIQVCEYSTTRVKVYDLSGTQIGLPGMGEDKQRLTFPAKFRVQAALSSGPWVQFATAEEEKVMGNWWAIAKTQPASIIFASGDIASSDLPIGFETGQVTALSQAAQVNLFEQPSGSLDDVQTPSYPSE